MTNTTHTQTIGTYANRPYTIVAYQPIGTYAPAPTRP